MGQKLIAVLTVLAVFLAEFGLKINSRTVTMQTCLLTSILGTLLFLVGSAASSQAVISVLVVSSLRLLPALLTPVNLLPMVAKD